MNLYKLYYKDYYLSSGGGYDVTLTDDGEVLFKSDELVERNIRLTSSMQLPSNDNPCCDPEHSLELIVSYPGLLTGVGIDHETGLDGEFKLGIHLDYTTGMPVVYGSSVKGVLRSFLKDFYSDFNNEVKVGTDITAHDVWMDVFEGKERDYEAEKMVADGVHRYKYKSIYRRDIFHDAVIISPAPGGKILEKDTIAPHKGGPLKNPIPISFVKIAPGCRMQFRFKLHPIKDRNGEVFMSEKVKKKLFKKILLEMGIGAKTNVGYGQFSVIEKGG